MIDNFNVTQNNLITGIDDATKCPCIGSIFIAGVVADQKTIDEWKKLGVKDSKLITHKKIQKLAKIIKETAINFNIQAIEPEKIDNKVFNLNEWEMLTVLQIINNLQKKVDLHNIYIDNWEVSNNLFKNRFTALIDTENKNKLLDNKVKLNRKKLLSVNMIAEHRADENYTIVGAASILAKDSSIKEYQKYKKKYGDFGSGSPADPKTRLFVWTNRNNKLPIIRKSWNTFKVLSIINNIDEDVIYLRILKNKLKK